MPSVQQFCQFLEAFAPHRLSEDWDNVGLLIGDRSRDVERVMTCLTVTPESVDEAVESGVNFIVTHHPVPFRPLKRITADNITGALLLKLMENQIAVYSPHTSFDSAARGINQRLAEKLGIEKPQPLEPFDNDPDGLGSGRFGDLSLHLSLADFAEQVKGVLDLNGLHIVGDVAKKIGRVAVACGSAGQFLGQAIKQGCHCLVTGETNFHTCLEAKANSVALVLPGHYASERFALDMLAESLSSEFSQCKVWASVKESDPLVWV